jgi:DNA-binding CsgD family transcriptional regulator
MKIFAANAPQSASLPTPFEQGSASAGDLEQLQAALQRQERRILEQVYMRRTNGRESIHDAVVRLGELGSVAGIRDRAAHELGVNSQFDRVVLSEVVDGTLVERGLWEREAVRSIPSTTAIRLEYPMEEHQLIQRHSTAALLVPSSSPRTPVQLAERFGWGPYAVGAIAAEGRVIGLLQADAIRSGRALDEVDRELLLLACAELGDVFVRASLRETIARHRVELESAAHWLSRRLSTTISPSASDPGVDGRDNTAQIAVSTLTAREREILAHLARGETNAQIGAALKIREGTVKYHVKNLLRKLGARSRADAVARFARATGAAAR